MQAIYFSCAPSLNEKYSVMWQYVTHKGLRVSFICWKEQLSRRGDESLLQKALDESKREMEKKGGVWKLET